MTHTERERERERESKSKCEGLDDRHAWSTCSRDLYTACFILQRPTELACISYWKCCLSGYDWKNAEKSHLWCRWIKARLLRYHIWVCLRWVEWECFSWSIMLLWSALFQEQHKFIYSLYTGAMYAWKTCSRQQSDGQFPQLLWEIASLLLHVRHFWDQVVDCCSFAPWRRLSM